MRVEAMAGSRARNAAGSSYNGAKYLDGRREMMTNWANYLDALCAGANVTAIRKAG